jgi:hypothetical protein
MDLTQFPEFASSAAAASPTPATSSTETISSADAVSFMLLAAGLGTAMAGDSWKEWLEGRGPVLIGTGIVWYLLAKFVLNPPQSA